MKKRAFTAFLVAISLSLILAACAAGPGDEAVCGDGICSEGEDASTCEADCGVEIAVLPTETPEPTATQEIDPLGFVTFAVYVSDIVHHNQSAETVLALVDLFEQYGVAGEFYISGPMTQIYAQEYGEVIERLRATDMGISYHVQPPHPLVAGFQGPISGLPVDETGRMITRYESERLDLETGGLIPEEPGGYRYLEELFGSPPVAVDAPKTSRSGFALPVLARFGARVVVLPRETDPQQPFIEQYSMLVRPADLLINRWGAEGVEGERNWWEMQASELKADFSPQERLMNEAKAWDSERLPFILIPIHEYSFYRSGPAPWSLIYYQDAARSTPKSAPFDLNAADPSSPRTEADQQEVWEAYAGMVEWGSIYLDPVTSEDILALAGRSE